jgi:hypothetical protein
MEGVVLGRQRGVTAFFVDDYLLVYLHAVPDWFAWLEAHAIALVRTRTRHRRDACGSWSLAWPPAYPAGKRKFGFDCCGRAGLAPISSRTPPSIGETTIFRCVDCDTRKERSYEGAHYVGRCACHSWSDTRFSGPALWFFKPRRIGSVSVLISDSTKLPSPVSRGVPRRRFAGHAAYLTNSRPDGGGDDRCRAAATASQPDGAEVHRARAHHGCGEMSGATRSVEQRREPLLDTVGDVERQGLDRRRGVHAA